MNDFGDEAIHRSKLGLILLFHFLYDGCLIVEPHTHSSVAPFNAWEKNYTLVFFRQSDIEREQPS